MSFRCFFPWLDGDDFPWWKSQRAAWPRRALLAAELTSSVDQLQERRFQSIWGEDFDEKIGEDDRFTKNAHKNALFLMNLLGICDDLWQVYKPELLSNKCPSFYSTSQQSANSTKPISQSSANLPRSRSRRQELERQGFSLPEALVKAAITEAKAQGATWRGNLGGSQAAGFHGEKVEKWLGFWEDDDDDDDDDDDFKFPFDEIRCFDEKQRVERMMNGHRSDWKRTSFQYPGLLGKDWISSMKPWFTAQHGCMATWKLRCCLWLVPRYP